MYCVGVAFQEGGRTLFLHLMPCLAAWAECCCGRVHHVRQSWISVDQTYMHFHPFFRTDRVLQASSFNVVVAARKPFTVMKPCGAGGHLTHGGQ